MYYPNQKEFLKLSKKGNLIPVYKEILGDLDTPVSAYLKVAQKSKYSFLLESVEGEEKVARFSFLANVHLQPTGSEETVFLASNGTARSFATRARCVGDSRPITEALSQDTSVSCVWRRSTRAPKA